MKTTRLLLSVLGGATVVVLSCGDPSPLGVGSRGLAPQANLIDSLLHTIGEAARGLVKCSPLPYDSVTKTIGPEGDTLQVGPHTLRVPPGALNAPVSITAVAPSDTVNRVDFQPEGLAFAQPASLVMSYANCDVSRGGGGGGYTPQDSTPQASTPEAPTPLASTPLASTPPESTATVQARPPLRIAYTTDSLAIIEYLESADDPTFQKVTGRLDHFSDYAIAW